ncbi:MAG: hypothetical protein JW839_07020 [Candidatus Lokiarchaeota archaeon]|nr:hypothetical protein [Candidatus Lokiarchaeota archaeon]
MDLSTQVDKTVTVTGRISGVPWQHIVASVEGCHSSEYFDLDDGYQIVVYLKNPITEKGRISVTGKVIGVRGGSKRPGAAKSEPYTEYHVVVDSWRPAPQ